jgi:hypothetical protein
VEAPILVKPEECEEFIKIIDVTPVIVSEDEDEAFILEEIVVPTMVFDQPRSEDN